MIIAWKKLLEGGERMGMSDRQFDAYNKTLLGRLVVAKEEIEEKGTSKELDKVIKEIDETLKRP